MNIVPFAIQLQVAFGRFMVLVVGNILRTPQSYLRSHEKPWDSVSFIQPSDSRRAGFGKPLRMSPGGEWTECVVKECSIASCELSGHAFSTILESTVPAFQSSIV